MQDNNSIEIFIPKVKNPLIININDLHIYHKYKWYYDKRDNRLFTGGGSRYGIKTIHIYKLILDLKRHICIDHINGNRMDNRRCNLRVCSLGQNNINKKKIQKFSSIYKGVFWAKDREKWRAQIKFKYIRRHIGTYDNEIDAAKAYDIKAKELFGEFAILNFPC